MNVIFNYLVVEILRTVSNPLVEEFVRDMVKVQRNSSTLLIGEVHVQTFVKYLKSKIYFRLRNGYITNLEN